MSDLRAKLRASTLGKPAAPQRKVVTIEGINAPPGMAKRLFSFLSLGLLKDWKYLQFAVRAELRDVPGN